LHQEEIQAAQHAKEVEQMEIPPTTTGQATLFVEKILEAHDNLLAAIFTTIDASKISAVAKDDMAFLADRMLEAQETSQQKGRDPTSNLIHRQESKHFTASILFYRNHQLL
jgi:hypothetical protein